MSETKKLLIRTPALPRVCHLRSYGVI